MTNLKQNKFKNFVTDDPAEINFGSRLDPHNLPKTVNAIDTMHSGTAEGKVTLDLADLTYLATVKGGIRNPDAKHHRYTTDYQTYHLYATSPTEGTAADPDSTPHFQFQQALRLVVVSVNGSGNQWITIDYCDKGNSVLYAVKHLPNPIAHDILNALFYAYLNGHSHATRKTKRIYHQAFVDGRLKKRKVRGSESYRVEIEEPKTENKGMTLIKIGPPTPFEE